MIGLFKPCKGLEHLPNAVPKHKLSKGNNCRRTIIKPSSNLDSEQAEKIMDIFKSLAEKGKTVLIVTHDEKSASVCDEKFVLEEGMLKKSLILSGGVD